MFLLIKNYILNCFLYFFRYQKYLYDYECDHENLSCLSDLTAAIEGNRREGRRTNTCELSGSASISSNGPPNLIINNSNNNNSSLENISNDTMAAAAAAMFPYQLMGPMGAIFGKHINFNLKGLN